MTTDDTLDGVQPSMFMCRCVIPQVDSPPLAPLVPAAPFQPTRAQIRFMRLHAWHLVEKWQWHWLNTMLRATTDRGVTRR